MLSIHQSVLEHFIKLYMLYIVWCAALDWTDPAEFYVYDVYGIFNKECEDGNVSASSNIMVKAWSLKRKDPKDPCKGDERKLRSQSQPKCSHVQQFLHMDVQYMFTVTQDYSLLCFCNLSPAGWVVLLRVEEAGGVQFTAHEGGGGLITCNLRPAFGPGVTIQPASCSTNTHINTTQSAEGRGTPERAFPARYGHSSH